MKPKKQRKVMRYRLPNLCQPGLKFDNFNNPMPSYFDKISNNFKLLQQPLLQKDKAVDNPIYTSRKIKRRQTISIRVKQLAKPKQHQNKQRSFSLPQQIKFKKKNTRQRYSFSQMSRGSSKQKQKYKEAEIISSGLASLPLSKILEERENLLKAREKTITQESQSQTQYINSISEGKKKEDFKPGKDFIDWLDKIIGNQGKLYEQYQRNMLQKVSVLGRKRKNDNFQSSWK